MPNRIPTPGVSSPAVRKSPGAVAPAKPAQAKVKAAESALNRATTKGVKDLTATRQAIAKKTGVWPNGRTN